MFHSLILAAATIVPGIAAPADTCQPAVELVTPTVTVIADTDETQVACWFDNAEPGTVYGRIAISRADTGELVVVITSVG